MKIVSKIMLLVLGIGLVAHSAHAGGKPGRGELYYEGMVVKTIVPPAAMKQTGTENFYVIFENADADMPRQRPVIATAPGDKGYRGGKWAFNKVVWTGDTEPYELMSAMEVYMAKMLGDITIDRIPENDFKCPVQK